MQSILRRRRAIKVAFHLAKCCCSLFVDIYSVFPMVLQLADKCFSVGQDAFLRWTMFAYMFVEL